MRKAELWFVIGRIVSDGAMIFLALLLAYFLRMHWFGALGLAAPTTLFPFTLFSLFAVKTTAILLLTLGLHGRYRFYADQKVWDEVLHLFWGFSAGIAVLLVIFFFGQFSFFSRFILGVAWLTGLGFLLLGRAGLRFIRKKFHQWGWGREKILILGSGPVAREVIALMAANPQFDIIGVLTEKKSKTKTLAHQSVLGDFGDFGKVLEKHQPSEIFLANEHSAETLTAPLIRLAHIHHAKFHFVPDELGLDLAAVEISTLGKYPLVTLWSNRITGWGLFIKTIADYVVATLALILLTPIMVWVAWKIKKQDRGPILYSSERVGKDGQTFACLKFRSMVIDADQKKKKLLKKNQRKGGVLFKLEDDPRITDFGHFLRTRSLDELPQLINVLKGEMSLIGPRPHLPEEVRKYPKDDLRVLSVKPGLTGFAQVNGRSNLSFDEEMNFELFYLKNWSIWLDVVIFFKTIAVLFQRKNVS
jgi:exopolysaccharide biosynthesis polyprenyl glycosylphosphotransferase